MTIEKDLSEIRTHLGRIAAALEGLLAEHGHVPTSPTTVEQPDEPKPAKKKKSKKKGKKPTKVGKQDDDDRVFTLPDIRAELHKLQEAESQAAVKSLLKKYNASTLGQVDEAHFPKIMDDIAEALE